MPDVPAHCDDCGLTWEPRGAITLLPGGEGTRLIGNATRCPNCGGLARFIEGTFSVRDGMIEVLAAPDWSMQALRLLQRAAQEAEALADTDPEAAVSLIARVSARVGAFLRHANAANQSAELGGLKAVLKWLGYAAGGALAAKATIHANLTVEEIARIVDEALRQIRS